MGRQAGHLQFTTLGHPLRDSIWGNVPRKSLDGVGQNLGVYIRSGQHMPWGCESSLPKGRVQSSVESRF